MQILFLTKKLPYPARDGEAIASSTIIEHIAALGHNITVLSIITPKHNFTLDAVPKKIRDKVQFHLVFADTQIRPLQLLANLPGKMPYHITRFMHYNIREKIREILTNNSFDIIQFEGLFLFPYLNTIQKFSTAKVIYRSHNIEGNIWRRMAETLKNPLKKWYLKLQAERLVNYEVSILNKVDAIVPISTADELFYKQKAPHQIVVSIATGIDAENLPEKKPEINNIYFLGALDWLPNQQGLIWFIETVLPLIKRNIPDASLHVAGRNAPLSIVNKISAASKYYGEINDKTEFIEDKAICIAPLFAGSGLKIKIIEALAAGKIIITTPVGAEGMPLHLEKYMYICETSDNMAETMIKIMRAPHDALLMAKEGRQVVENKLTHAAVIQQFIDLYKTLMS